MIMKRYVLFAGVNGAGKTTLYQANPQLWDMPRVNMDEIVRSSGSWRNSEDVFYAGLQAVRIIDKYFENGVSFNQETTLCGKSIIRYISRAKERGYSVEMHYVGLDSVETAKDRIHQRIQAGGHGVPDDEIERRYDESLLCLTRIIPYCDQVYLYDNSDRFLKIASFRNDSLTIISKTIPEWATGVIKSFI